MVAILYQSCYPIIVVNQLSPRNAIRLLSLLVAVGATAMGLSGCGRSVVSPVAPVGTHVGYSTFTPPPTRPLYVFKCISTASLTVNHPSPARTNSTIDLSASITASASCPGVEYQFLVQAGSQGAFAPMSAWSSSDTATFTTPSSPTTLTFKLLVGTPPVPTFVVVSTPLVITAPPPPPPPAPSSASTPTPKSPLPSTTPPTSTFYVSGTKYYSQIYTEDCETASLEMALSHEGIFISQSTLLGDENVQDGSGPTMSGSNITAWYNPYVGFVGNPNGNQTSSVPTGYGVYYPVISSVASHFGGRVLFAGTGLSDSSVYADIAANHPVIAWVSDNNNGYFVRGPISYWTVTPAYSGSGQRIPYVDGGYNEHCVLVVGVNASSVYIFNPLSFIGPEWVSKSAFANTFATFGDMAVVLG